MNLYVGTVAVFALVWTAVAVALFARPEHPSQPVTDLPSAVGAHAALALGILVYGTMALTDAGGRLDLNATVSATTTVLLMAVAGLATAQPRTAGHVLVASAATLVPVILLTMAVCYGVDRALFTRESIGPFALALLGYAAPAAGTGFLLLSASPPTRPGQRIGPLAGRRSARAPARRRDDARP